MVRFSFSLRSSFIVSVFLAVAICAATSVFRIEKLKNNAVRIVQDSNAVIVTSNFKFGKSIERNEVIGIDISGIDANDNLLKALSYFPNLDELTYSRKQADLFTREKRLKVKNAIIKSMRRRFENSSHDFSKETTIGHLCEDFELAFNVKIVCDLHLRISDSRQLSQNRLYKFLI